MFVRSLAAVQCLGPTTILSGLVLSHAPHHENEEFEIMLWLHADMRVLSYAASKPWPLRMNVLGWNLMFLRVHSTSSVKIKRVKSLPILETTCV